MHRRAVLTVSAVVLLAIVSTVIITAAPRSQAPVGTAVSLPSAASVLSPAAPSSPTAPSSPAGYSSPSPAPRVSSPPLSPSPTAALPVPSAPEPDPSGAAEAGESPAPAGEAAVGERVILVAGDIASCSWRGDTRTARLIGGRPGTVMTTGDNVYQTGTFRQFVDCYEPTWGRFKSRTRPTPGNHDWASGGNGYFRYFGALAGPSGRGYYAFTVGEWRIYALTGDCWRVGGCGADGPQYQWLEEQLTRDPRDCVMAVWHQPRWSSGPHGGLRAVRYLHSLLYRHGAEIVVNGHDHFYERFAPMRPDATRDDGFGIRQFIVGTGGGPLYAASAPYAPNSVVRNDSTHGVLRLKLNSEGYRWRFIPVEGEDFRDSGTGNCHGAPPA